MERKRFANGNEIVDFGITKDSVNVYICLDNHLKRCNGVYPGNNTIAKECGISKEAVQKSIEQLNKIGFITKRSIK